MTATEPQWPSSHKATKADDALEEDEEHVHEEPNIFLALTHKPLDVSGLYTRAKRDQAGAVLVFAGTTRNVSRPEGLQTADKASTSQQAEGKDSYTRRTDAATASGASERNPRPAISNITMTGSVNVSGGGHVIAGNTIHGGNLHVGGGNYMTFTPTDQSVARPDHSPTPPAVPDGYARVESLRYTAYPPRAMKSLLKIAKTVQKDFELCAVAIAHRLGEVPIGEESVVVAVSAPHRDSAFRGDREALEQIKKELEVWKYEVFEGDGGRGYRSNAVDGGGPSTA